MMKRHFSKATWESKVGYCRAVRSGDVIAVSGTGAVDESGAVAAPGDAFGQARVCLQILEKALKQLGGKRSDVIRTRMFVTDISKWSEFAKAHREFFSGEDVPATSMVEVRKLIDPQMLIEIEADAIVRRR